MTDHIHDVECYPNFFCVGFMLTTTGELLQCEISARRNDGPMLMSILSTMRVNSDRMVGFNNFGYDYPLIHYCMLHNFELTTEEIYAKSQSLIDTPWDNRFDKVIWENEQIVQQIDLFKIHHFDNVSRATSLKALEFNMRSRSIQDLPYLPGTILTPEQMDVLLTYNIHDIKETYKFYIHSLDLIKFREELSTRYDHSFLNYNDTKIGKKFFEMRLEEALPGSCYDENHQKRQTYRASIPLKNVIFPYIKFHRPEFIRILEWFRAQTITETKGVFKDLSCTIDGFQYDFGTGGIHGSVPATTVVETANLEILDIDVKSYYPNIAIKNQLYPEHLSPTYCEIYADLYEQRAATDKKSPENAMLKLALNGVYGDSNNVYSVFYDPAYTMAVTINGQLLLCMLAEKLITVPGLSVIQINTDGLTVLCQRALRPLVDNICKWWEGVTHLELEYANYNRMFIRDVNHYLAEYVDGSLKRKGAYQTEEPGKRRPLGWHQDMGAMIVPQAAEAALVNGVDIASFIIGHSDPFDFMRCTKIKGRDRLELDGVPHQKNTRYYYSKKGGAEFMKIMPPLARQLKINPQAPNRRITVGGTVGWIVTECNNMDTFDMSNLDVSWYIEEAHKLVDPLL